MKLVSNDFDARVDDVMQCGTAWSVRFVAWNYVLLGRTVWTVSCQVIDMWWVGSDL